MNADKGRKAERRKKTTLFHSFSSAFICVHPRSSAVPFSLPIHGDRPMTRCLLAALAASLFLGALGAQLPIAPPSPQAAPLYQIPPLFHVKIVGPRGMQITVYRGGAPGLTFDTPCVIGFRPGFRYRLALTEVPAFPLDTFAPLLEVRGSLVLGPKLRAADFPATLTFTEEEFAKVKATSNFKKVILLERADTAIPQASKADEPIEISLPPNRDPLFEARNRG